MRKVLLLVSSVALLSLTVTLSNFSNSNFPLFKKLSFAIPARAGTTSSSASREPPSRIVYPNVIEGSILSPSSTDSEGELLSPTSDEVTTRAVARPDTRVATFDVTITRRPFRFKIYDNGTQDGDIVRVIFNGRVINRSLVLTNAGQTFDLTEQNDGLKRAVNRLEIIALNAGSVPPNTVTLEYPGTHTLNGNPFGAELQLEPRERFVTTVGFPQIAICKTRVRFPCRTRPYPESSQHVLEALGVPPEPIRAAVRPGRTGNPVRPRYPRLLTIDRNNSAGPVADRRRDRSTSAYEPCPPRNGQRQQLDEYPPATFLENSGSAHIKCILGSDNEGSGRSFAIQIGAYAEVSGGQTYRLDNGDTIEFVVLD